MRRVRMPAMGREQTLADRCTNARFQMYASPSERRGLAECFGEQS